MAFSIEEKINLFDLKDILRAGIFSLQDNGNYIMVKDMNKKSNLFGKEYYYDLKDEFSLDTILSDSVKKIISRPEDVFTNLKEYSKFLHDMIDDYKEPRNRYFLSLSEKNMPKELEALAMKSLRIKSIHDDPDDAYVLIITFYPAKESSVSNIVWNVKYESENVLLGAVEKIVYLMKDVPSNKKRSLINQIIRFLMNKMEEKVKSIVDDEEDDDRIDASEAAILNKMLGTENTSNVEPRMEMIKTDLTKKQYDMWQLQGQPKTFYQFAYEHNVFKVQKFKLKEDSLHNFYTDEFEYDAIRFDTIDDLMEKLLLLKRDDDVTFGKILPDGDKINLKRIIAKKYLYLKAPFSDLKNILKSENTTELNKEKEIRIENTDTGKVLDSSPAKSEEPTLENVSKKQEEFGIGNKYNPVSELGREPENN